MVKPTRLHGSNGNFIITMSDSRRYYAVPVGVDLWTVLGSDGAPIDPDPDPPIGSGMFTTPFSFDTVWDYNEFRSPSRPTHDGIDFGPGLGIVGGESIKAAGDGVIDFAGWGGDWFNSPGFGNLVVIDHGMHNGKRLHTRYAHMRALPVVTTGDPITRGTHMGDVGDTGNAVGEHLHWETLVDNIPTNPRDFMAVYGG